MRNEHWKYAPSLGPITYEGKSERGKRKKGKQERKGKKTKREGKTMGKEAKLKIKKVREDKNKFWLTLRR